MPGVPVTTYFGQHIHRHQQLAQTNQLIRITPQGGRLVVEVLLHVGDQVDQAAPFVGDLGRDTAAIMFRSSMMNASVASRPMGSGKVVWRTWHLAYSCLAAGPEQTGPRAMVAAESPVALQLLEGHATLGIRLCMPVWGQSSTPEVSGKTIASSPIS